MGSDNKYPHPEINIDICKGCQLCVSMCPREVLEISEKLNSKGFHYSIYRGEGCIGCGNCFYVCPEPDGITVYMKDYEGEVK